MFRRRGHTEPPATDWADEPVVFRTGPHWIGTDLTLGLALLTALAAAYSVWVDPDFWRFVPIPAVPFALRLAVDIPRYWHFDVVLTSRRLIVNVGIARDVYHTLRVSHIDRAELRQNPVGKALGFGDVVVTLDATDEEGVRHTGTYSLDFVRDPVGLREAITTAIAPFKDAERG